MTIRRTIVFLLMAAHGSWSCGGSPTTPSTTAKLPLASETASMRYYHEPGDTIRACQKTKLSLFVFLQALMAGPNTCDVNVIH